MIEILIGISALAAISCVGITADNRARRKKRARRMARARVCERHIVPKKEYKRIF